MTAADARPWGRRVGLLAGGGRFPLYFAQAARRQGMDVVCVAVSGHADADLQSTVSRLYWTGLAKIGRMIRCFRREGIDTMVMAGKIRKAALFAPWRLVQHLPDWRTIRFWLSRRRRDNKDDSLLLSVVEEFQAEGIRVASALEVCPELLVPPGRLTRRAPLSAECRDIAFGWTLAKEMGRLDVGQTVAVRERAVLAVEAIEGTDEAILRAGSLCGGGGFTVVKVAKPNQDMRFDVPTVGVRTIETMARGGGRVLAIEAHKTILMDAEQTLALANRSGIAFVAVTENDLERLAAGQAAGW